MKTPKNRSEVAINGFLEVPYSNLAAGPDATEVNSPVNILDGALNEAVRFDGSTNYLNATTSAHPNSTTGLGAGSIAFWVRSTTTSTSDHAVMGSFNSNPSKTGLAVDFNNGPDGDFRAYVRSEGNDPAGPDTSGGSELTSWNDGQWHHVAASWDQDTVANNLIYFDGLSTPSSQGTAVGETYAAWENFVAIGAINVRGTITSFLDGDLDELRTYDHVLSQAEVTALVPEPSSFLLMIVAGALCFGQRRRVC